MSDLSKDDLLAMLDRLGLYTQFFCDSGVHYGHYAVGMRAPYIRTNEWDRLQAEIREYRQGRVS